MAEYTDKDRKAMVDQFVNEARGGGGANGQSPEDQFINNANQQDNKSVIPSVDEGDARFLQNSINMYNQAISKKSGNAAPNSLLVDGIIGPKSKEAFKNAYSTIPPAMRKALGKKLNKG